MNRIIAFLAALAAGLPVSVGAFANGSTWTFPYSGSCGGPGYCLNLDFAPSRSDGGERFVA